MIDALGSALAWPWSTLIARLLLGSIFITASLIKLQERSVFAKSVQQYAILPGPIAGAFAFLLPWLELPAAVMVLAGFLTWLAAAVLAVLLAIFMIAILVVIKKRLAADCGCFGSLQRGRAGMRNLIQDFFLLILAVHAVLFDSGQLALSEVIPNLPNTENVLALILFSVAVLFGVSVSQLAVQAKRSAGA